MPVPRSIFQRLASDEFVEARIELNEYHLVVVAKSTKESCNVSGGAGHFDRIAQHCNLFVHPFSRAISRSLSTSVFFASSALLSLPSPTATA